MTWALRFSVTEKSVMQDKNFLYTIASYFAIAAVFINLDYLQSPFLGLVATIIYFAINSVFLGGAFFKNENAFFRLALGILSLIMLLGFVGWLILTIQNLNTTMSTLVLVVVTTFSSIMNRRMRNKNGSN